MSVPSRTLFATLLVALMTLTAVDVALASHSSVVSPHKSQGWGFAVETGSGSGSFVTGPETAPSGLGSAELVLDGASSGVVLGTAWAETRFDAIDALEYSTYQDPGNANAMVAAALQFNVDYDLTDAATGWQGRLVFEPYRTETVLQGEWQTWDPLAGEWWASGAPGNGVCPQANPCTWDEVLTAFPDAGIHPDFGAVLFKAGSGWGAFEGNVDAFTITVDGMVSSYDFEPGKDACKKGGWQDSASPEFKNQGRCVSYVASGGKAKH